MVPVPPGVPPPPRYRHPHLYRCVSRWGGGGTRCLWPGVDNQVRATSSRALKDSSMRRQTSGRISHR